MKRRSILEPARRVPIAGEYDVVVVGGGIAGAAAAVSAARNGAKVCLIEKENALGGLATLGNIWGYVALCDGYGRQIVGGLGEEFIKASVKYGEDHIPPCWKRGGDKSRRGKDRYFTRFAPDSFLIALDEICVREGVKLSFDTRFCDAITRAGRVEAILVENKAGRSALPCKVVVDASGDADVLFRAGERTFSSDDNRKSCWAYYAVDGKLVGTLQQDPIYGPVARSARTYRGEEPDDVTEMNLQSRKLALRAMRRLQRDYGADEVSAIKLPSIPLFRMTRRLKGVFELSQRHLRTWLPDAIGMTGLWGGRGPVLAIPYGCLIGRKIGNVIAAGRCISAAGKAWDITRVIPPCAVTGQAAGTAAAMAARKGCDFADVNVPALQRRLRKHKAIIDEKLVTESRPS